VKYCSKNLTERKGLRARKNQDSLTPTSAILSVYAAAQSASTIPEKSIAVLPFENRSEEKANAYFADEIQDEILTRLSKTADLKSSRAHARSITKARRKTCLRSPGNLASRTSWKAACRRATTIGPRFSDASLVTAAWLITAREPGTLEGNQR
jgi:hypothetical protein